MQTKLLHTEQSNRSRASSIPRVSETHFDEFKNFFGYIYIAAGFEPFKSWRGIDFTNTETGGVKQKIDAGNIQVQYPRNFQRKPFQILADGVLFDLATAAEIGFKTAIGGGSFHGCNHFSA